VETTNEINALAPGGQRFTIGAGKRCEVEKAWGKSFKIGKLKGFVGKAALKRRSKVKWRRIGWQTSRLTPRRTPCCHILRVTQFRIHTYAGAAERTRFTAFDNL